MIDPADEINSGGTGATWRLRRPEGHGAKALDRPIVFELTDTNATNLVSISIPPEKIEELLKPHLSIFFELQLDGSVPVDSEFFSLFPPPTTTDILELVRRALTPEMLQDEPNLPDQLKELRRKLTESLALVDKTLADLEKPEP
jgi:hypothetical protein